MNSYFIGIDIGTQGVRVGICDEIGKMIVQHEKKHCTNFPKTGWAEQSPHDWWGGVNECMKACTSGLAQEIKSNIKACCVCCTSSTVLPIDSQGSPLAEAMMWMDNRSADQVDFINSTKHPVLEYCGGAVSIEWMIPKLLWIKQNQPELYSKCYKVVEQLDWINFKLTGNFRSSICNAVCKWNYIQKKGGFQEDYFKLIGLEDYKDKLIQDILKIGEVVGVIMPDFAEEYGLNPEMVVVQGAIDAHMSIFGLNVINPGKVGIIMGTSFVHLSLSERKDFTGVWGPYDSAIIDDLWLLEGGQISSSSIINWFIGAFGVISANPYDTMMHEAMQIPAGSDGLVMLDFFQGNRTPYKDERATGVIQGLRLKHTRGHIYRAILEAVACGTRNIIENLEIQDYKVDSITACGGVTKDPLWIQIIADVTGKKIIINENIQAGVLGCCVVAASCGRHYPDFYTAAENMVKESEIISPNLANKDCYDKLFSEYKQLYINLRGHIKKEI